MWLLDQIEEKDKEHYDKIFNEFKTVYCKAYGKNFTDEAIRKHLKRELEIAYELKADFVHELNEDDLILDNLAEFTEFCSKNIERLLRYLYWSSVVYTPYTYAKPKLHEMGYFTDNVEAFDNLKDFELSYVYGELIDYNGDCEKPYLCDFEDDTDIDVGSKFFEDNFAFYIPENTISPEKQEWYRSHAINVR
jgi:hypothetical protein